MISQRMSRQSLILSKNILSRNYGTKYTARLYGIRKDFVTVFYDGKCGLCSREINHYKKIAPNGKYQMNHSDVKLKDIHKFLLILVLHICSYYIYLNSFVCFDNEIV